MRRRERENLESRVFRPHVGHRRGTDLPVRKPERNECDVSVRRREDSRNRYGAPLCGTAQLRTKVGLGIVHQIERAKHAHQIGNLYRGQRLEELLPGLWIVYPALPTRVELF